MFSIDRKTSALEEERKPGGDQVDAYLHCVQQHEAD